MPRGELQPINFEPPKDREIQSNCGLATVFLTKKGVEIFLTSTKNGDGDLKLPLAGYRIGIDFQHRAQGAAGMVVIDEDGSYKVVRGRGFVSDVFSEGRNLPQVSRPKILTLQTRYPTSGNPNHANNVQPFHLDGIWFGHHGNLTNTEQIEEKIGPVEKDGEFPNNDSWVALNAIFRAEGKTLGEKLINAQRDFEGGWAFTVTDGKTVVASRDPHGIRPLSVGYLGSKEDPLGFVVSVESCVFENMGVTDYREVKPGETLQIDENGVTTLEHAPKEELLCSFEHVYMAWPTSEIGGELIGEVRGRLGAELQKEDTIELAEDEHLVIIPVPDSGRDSGLGYYNEARKKFGAARIHWAEPIKNNRYTGREFIKDKDKIDPSSKFHVMPLNLEELGIPPDAKYKIVVVDDSIVRGKTMRGLLQKLYDKWDHDVNVRSASAPVVKPSYWGVAHGTYEELLDFAAKSTEEKEVFLGLIMNKVSRGTLKYLSLEGMKRAINRKGLCTFCFGGEGPALPKSVIPLTATH